MAVKASDQITMTDMTDIDSTCRYYLLQSSTLSKPSKPTTNPPSSSWSKTEPSYTTGSTNSLYFTDLTVYSNGEFSYSDVSLSSSYEAAKAAYNKAVAAQNTANNAQTEATEAAKTATNFIEVENENLVIGKMEEQTFELLSDGTNQIVVTATVGDVFRIITHEGDGVGTVSYESEALDTSGGITFTNQWFYYPVYTSSSIFVNDHVVDYDDTGAERYEYTFKAGYEVYKQKTSLEKNVSITKDGLEIRKGKTVLASFYEKLIELGKTASDAIIKFCNGKGQIGINAEDELELSSDRIRMSSINDSMNSASVSSYVNRESDGYYINPSIGTSAHYDATGTYSSRANGYASMTAEVSTDDVQNMAEVSAHASENGSSVRINADEVLVNGVDVNKKLVYSTEEQVVGKWINGKSLYRKTISCGALPNNGTTRVSHGIDAIETLVDISGTATDGTTVLPLPCVATAALANNINVYVHKAVGGQINIQTGINRSSYTESYVTLLYTKVQD